MIGKRIDGSSAGQLRCRHLRRRLDWSPWLDRGPCSISDRHVRTGAFFNINSDLYHDHRGVIHGARGLNVNIALGRPCCFYGQRTCIRRHHLLERRFDDCFSGIVRNYVYNSHAKFRRVPMEESPTIYDIPEPCQIWTGIWTSLGRGLQSPARRSFGRSNRSSTAEFPYLPPLQISARSDGSNSGNLPMSGPIFGSVFCANTDPTRIHVSL